MPLGIGDAERLDDAAGHVLVEGDGERERIGAGVGDAEHLADGRHAGLARAADTPMPSAKLKTRSGGFRSSDFEKRPAVAEFDDGVAERTEHIGDGLHRDRGIELLVQVVGSIGRGRAVSGLRSTRSRFAWTAPTARDCDPPINARDADQTRA